MASLFTNELLPATSEEAIRQFNEKYLAVISAALPEGWADRFKLPVGSPRTTFPISSLVTKFRETKEESGRFETMLEKEFDLKVVEFDTGYEAKLLDITTNSYAYRRFMQAPSLFMTAEQRHAQRELAALLELGTSTTSPWDGVNFFSTAHLANPFDSTVGTFSNYQSAGTDPASINNISAEVTSMRGVLDENGDKIGAEPDEIWLPTGKFQAVSNLLNQNMIGSGESNPLLGKLKIVHVPELTDVNDWYLVDSKLISQGVDPMIAASYTPADSLGLRTFDESSDYFKNTGKIKIGKHIWHGFKLVFPHAIRKVVGA